MIDQKTSAAEHQKTSATFANCTKVFQARQLLHLPTSTPIGRLTTSHNSEHSKDSKQLSPNNTRETADTLHDHNHQSPKQKMVCHFNSTRPTTSTIPKDNAKFTHHGPDPCETDLNPASRLQSNETLVI